MSKSEYARLSKQMPEVFKIIRSAALDEAIIAVKVTLAHSYNADEKCFLVDKERVINNVRGLKHE